MADIAVGVDKRNLAQRGNVLENPVWTSSRTITYSDIGTANYAAVAFDFPTTRGKLVRVYDAIWENIVGWNSASSSNAVVLGAGKGHIASYGSWVAGSNHIIKSVTASVIVGAGDVTEQTAGYYAPDSTATIVASTTLAMVPYTITCNDSSCPCIYVQVTTATATVGSGRLHMLMSTVPVVGG